MTRLEQIKARLEKATPGPWHTCLGSGEHLMTAVAADLSDNKTILIADCLPEYAIQDGWVAEDHRPNMSLIAHAPDDLAALLAVIEAAEAWEEAHTRVVDAPHGATILEWKTRRDDLYAAVRACREGGGEVSASQ